jgi:hypothetical protein
MKTTPSNISYRRWPYWVEPMQRQQLTNAIALMLKHHDGQKRKYSGDPFTVHTIRVAGAIGTHPLMDMEDIASGYLHDTKEDTSITDEEILEATSEYVLFSVNELTNQTKVLKGVPRRDRKRMDWERLAKVTQKSKIKKMFDRQDNLIDMVNAPTDFKKLYIDESKQLLDYVGDGDPDVARQVISACDAIFGWRPFSIQELAKKPVGVEIEHPKHGFGRIVLADYEDTKIRIVSYKDGNIVRIPQSDPQEWALLRETGN